MPDANVHFFGGFQGTDSVRNTYKRFPLLMHPLQVHGLDQGTGKLGEPSELKEEEQKTPVVGAAVHLLFLVR